MLIRHYAQNHSEQKLAHKLSTGTHPLMIGKGLPAWIMQTNINALQWYRVDIVVTIKLSPVLPALIFHCKPSNHNPK